MHLDVTQLKAFYATPLGATVTAAVCHRLAGLLEPFRVARDNALACGDEAGGDEAAGANLAGAPKLSRPASQFKPIRWRATPGDDPNILALGYGVPYLEALQPDYDHAIALMPQAQGVYAWPSGGAYRSALVSDTSLPLPNACIDLLLGIHYLEMTHNPSASLREMWRVLRPEGSLVLVLPHRTGLWARVDGTPFGHGRPYSQGQITALLSDALFEPEECGTMLATPPFVAQRWRQLALGTERVGNALWPALAGTVLVKARKRVHAPIGRLVPARAPALAPASGLAAARAVQRPPARKADGSIGVAGQTLAA